MESPFYFGEPDGTARTGVFRDSDPAQEVVLPLSAEQQNSKRNSFAAFQTQQEVLAMFGPQLLHERFRVAPAYDFTQPACAGPGWYESFIPGLTAVRFAHLAADAQRTLRPHGVPA